ncbi:MAG: succinyldiaminopimelate transaminase [Actinomycetota bacterium]|nr:succinyldiaminopimelate transaminase [Actinomycetota bacterium]MDP2287156.1 succinyldiaminopimelate transaminase [Actinomycetota bacterium]
MGRAHKLPDFPWDLLAPYSRQAATHPLGIVDLSVGTPVDPTPAIIQQALIDAANAPGYPTAHGTLEVRASCAAWMQRILGADVDPQSILPTIGSKEAVAWLPTLLGLGADDHIVIPRVAYPTYAVGGALSGARVTATDQPESIFDAALIWLNTPANPTGHVLSAERMKSIVDHARKIGAIVASDECYYELAWDAQPVSVLHPSVCGPSHDGVLALHSLSKRSNFAGYRFGFIAGDPALVKQLLEVRKHGGLMVPAPVQHAAAVAYADDAHVLVQHERYGRRRQMLKAALIEAGFVVDDSAAGLYLWTTRGEPCWQTVAWFAERGVLVTPGDFYGQAGAHHVRIALTATDEAIAQVPARLAL